MTKSGSQNLLVASADEKMRAELARMLRAQSYVVTEASSSPRALELLTQHAPRLVLLDWDSPELARIELLHRIREQSSSPIIVLSTSDDDNARASAFDAGAIHYLTKPLREAGFMACIRAVLRLAGARRPEPGVTVAGCLRLDPAQGRAWVRGAEVALTRTEFRLLQQFMLESGRVLTHRHLLRQVWGTLHSRDVQYLRVYIKHLREKIERDPAHPEILVTAAGIGYRLVVSDSATPAD